jgi:hypothetical protein
LAKKNNDSADDIDLSLYGYAKGCSACHPGGGATEYDRDGNRLDDPETWKDATSLDGDYYGNKWLESGALEADCLICHLEDYDLISRNAEVSAGNFRSGPSAGAQFGTAVSNSEITYDETVFNASGSVPLENLSKRPSDSNCSGCHAGEPGKLFAATGKIKADIAKRGRTWNDPENPDVHNMAGLECADCHGLVEDAALGVTAINHQFGKGHAIVSTVRDDLDNTMLKCGECHTPGNAYDAPVPSHSKLSGHLDYIDCSTCHIPQKKHFAIRVKDFSSQAAKGYFVGGSPKNQHVGFKPSYHWWPTEAGGPLKIFPGNFMTVPFWNDGEALYSPVFYPKTVQAAGAAGLTDDVGDDGVAEVNTSDEIDAMRTQLMAQGVQDPKLVLSAHAFMMSHNIAPAEEALGAGGCSDCHSAGSHMFEGEIMMYNFEVGPSDHAMRHVTVKTKSGASKDLHMTQTMSTWELLDYTESQKEALIQPQGQAAVVTPKARSVVTVTLTDNGSPVAGAEVQFSRSVAGRSSSYRWKGVTGADGTAEIEITVVDERYWRTGVNGYYLVRAIDATTEATLDSWGSVPINGGKAIELRLPVGGSALIESVTALSGGTFALHPNHPNPFNPSTEIRYELPTSSDVRVAVYNLLGQQVRVLVQGSQGIGTHRVVWDGTDDRGRSVSSGIYVYRLTSAGQTQMRRMLLLK